MTKTAQTMLRRHRRYLGRRRAASLVEVLVVLVIILLAVFSVIRIFPIGFGTLRQSEKKLRADRLARNIQDQIALESANIPESIEFTYWNEGIPTTITNIDPDDMTAFEPGNPYFSDINKFRYIRNEPVKVPLPSGVGANFNVGSLYLLKFGPVYMDSTATDPNVFNSYLRITGEPLISVPFNSNGGQNGTAQGLLRGPGGYIIDYGEEGEGTYIMFPVTEQRVSYTLSYSYEIDGGAGGDSVGVQAPVTVTVDSAGSAGSVKPGVWLPISTVGLQLTGGDTIQGPAMGRRIVSGSDRLVRDFQRLAAGASWDPSDPYQYQLLSDNVAGTLANLGLIAFNPAGANYSERTPYGQRAFTALVSYAVLDWHILRDDREVPAGVRDTTSGADIAQIRTSLPNIIPLNDEQTVELADGKRESQPYRGLYPDISDENQRVDIQVFNMTTMTDSSGTPGTALVRGDYENRTTSDRTNVDYWVSRSGRGGTYPSGVIYVNTNRVPAGTRLRVLYKSQGDWGVTIQKAASLYTVVGGSGERPPTYGTDGTGNPSECAMAPAGRRLYFHRCELNKSILATIEYQTTGPVRTVRLSPQQFTIKEVDSTDPNYAYVDLSKAIPAGASWRLVNNEVRGVSLKTRVVYRDNASYRNPWRVLDQETFITRSPGLN